jgi:hypothetical protein
MLISYEDKIINNNNNSNFYFNNNKNFNKQFNSNSISLNIKKTSSFSEKENFQVLAKIKNFISFINIIDIIWKCFLAFILGALISERKFIYMGKI